MITVLYVDDEPGLLEVGKLYLERHGEFHVDTVTSAKDALRVIKTENYDAIISDYQMPEMNGIDLLKEVRASGNPIPFIIFTGRGREEVVIQALNEGADFYLQKGGEPAAQFAELVHKVRQAVHQRRAEISIRDHERMEADILNFLPDATFAIDTRGVVIAWNRAIERMTGIAAEYIVGKGNYEYAIPFYHERRPILIDLVLSDDPATAQKYPFIQREGNKIFSEITIPHFNNGLGAVLWFTASPLYNTRGEVIGAIESIREITERKRVLEALNESERRFRELAEMLPQVIYETDASGMLTYANRIAFEMFGYAEEDLQKGLNAIDMIAPEDRDRAFATFYDILEKGSTTKKQREYRAIRRDGSTFPVSIYSSPVVQGGSIVGLRGIIVDISDLKRAEERIRENEQNYRLLFETATEGILVAQEDRMVHVNPALVRILGYPVEDLTSRPFTDFIHPDDREKVMARHMQRMRGGVPPTGYMFRIIRADGEERWLWINSTSITWSGKPATLSFITDMTEQKKAEMDLLSTNREYTNLLDQIQDVYYRSDNDGRLTKASKSWAALLGYDDLSSCIGRSIADDFYVNPPDREKLLDDLIHHGKVTNYEVMLKKRDGSPVLVETSSHFYYDSNGNVLGVEGTFRDITERKRQESALHTQLSLGLALQKVRSLDESLEICLAAAIDISGMDRGGIYIVDDLTRAVDLKSWKNFPEGLVREISHYPPDSTQARIIQAGQPIFLSRSDLQSDTHGLTQEGSVQSLAMIPIKSGETVIACLYLSSLTDREIPGHSRVALETIATQIGAAIERIRAEEALAKSEEQYRNVVEDQTELISRFLPDGTHVFVNNAYCRYFGFSREEILGHRFKPVIPREDKERVRQFFESLTEQNPVGSIEHRIIMPDGSIRWQRWSDRAIYDAKGALIEYQSVGRDITEIRDALEALHEKEDWYQGLSQVSPDLIFMVDQKDRVVYVNSAAATMLGKEPGEIIGHPRSSLFPPEISEPQRYAIEHVFKTGERFRREGEMHIGGSKRWYDHMLYPVRGRQGNVMWIFGISRDITEQKKIEEELRRKSDELDSRNRVLTTLLETVPIGIFMVEAPTGRPIVANREATRLLGRGILPDATEENLAQVYKAFKAGTCKKYPTDEMPIVRGMKGEVSHIDDMVVVRPDDTRVHLEVFGTPVLDRNGNVVASLVSFFDVTERKRAEMSLKEINRKLALLSSITRHDIANQLIVLQGFAQIAMEKETDRDITALLEKIDNAAAMIARQIEFTRTYQEIGMHEPAWFSLAAIIDKMQRFDVPLISRCSDAEIFADPMIEKVFSNLFDNSVRHGGHVTAISIRCEQNPDHLAIIYEDNGVGIPDEKKEEIFKRGFGDHTGLGLFLSREILGITGISISETGVYRRGARFEIHVPAGAFRNVSCSLPDREK
ncbi:MAG TPA: PAS domain S-box protein [Methanolinea sp.]|nr:PAS domain S-box protein [Methanolinea sp.]HQK55106.1 PAS domain S-box protein [Methanolinea sp.]